MEKIRNLLGWGRRYISFTLLIVVAYLAFLLFFNENSMMRSIDLDRTIDSLRTEIRVNQDSLEYYKALNNRLSTSPEEMERVAREQYNMNRPDEDVYVFK
ncbi:MAG: septum formation initiator family protein [Muribaculaceae bacterium]|jgi:cell division protein FtsB|nr:septum formation initiator family protein [Muribaculaceae bacterium]HUN20615.1 septum formation initiator family protein [Muribaculaceae bacterium]